MINLVQMRVVKRHQKVLHWKLGKVFIYNLLLRERQVVLFEKTVCISVQTHSSPPGQFPFPVPEITSDSILGVCKSAGHRK